MSIRKTLLNSVFPFFFSKEQEEGVEVMSNYLIQGHTDCLKVCACLPHDCPHRCTCLLPNDIISQEDFNSTKFTKDRAQDPV
jgi:hypothetical protein